MKLALTVFASLAMLMTLSRCGKAAIASEPKGCQPKLSIGKEVWQVKALCAKEQVVVGSGYNAQGQYVIACAPVAMVCAE